MRRRTAATWLAIVSIGSLALARGEASRAWIPDVDRPSSARTSQSAQAPPTFRTGTTLIEVDVVVTDRTGRFADDLALADFEVSEDGAPQRVESFYLVRHGEIRSSVVPPPVSPIRSVVPAPAPIPASATQRVFVLVFDLEHSQPGGIERAKKAAEQFISKEFGPGDIGGVVFNGRMANNRLTAVPEELLAAVRSVSGAGEARALIAEMRQWPRLLDPYEVYLVDRGDREAVQRAIERACSDDPSGCSGGRSGTHGLPVDQQVTDKARRLVGELRASGQRLMLTVAAVANGLARVPGRKAMVLLSDGFFVEGSWGNLRQVTDLAARASVRIYTLDTRGLNRGSASSEILETGPRGSANPAGEPSSFDAAADGPNSLAVDTGGLVVRNENDFSRALREFSEDTHNYYVLGYRPTNTTFDGRFRSITVRVNRPGVRIRARRGYLATPDRIRDDPGVQPAAPVPPAPPAVAPTPPAAAPVVPAPPAAAATAGAPVPTGGGAAVAAAPVNAGDLEPLAVRARPDVRAQVDSLTTTTRGAARDALSEALQKEARRGWEAYQRGDLEAASVSLGRVATDKAAPPWVHYSLGWAQYAQSRYSAAGEQWEQVRSLVPQFAPVYFDLADSYLQQREFGRAVSVLREAQRLWPNDSDVHNALGVVQAGRGALNDAIETFERAVAVNPQDATAHYNLARTLEIRYVRGQRERRTSSSIPASALAADRLRAIDCYRRTVTLGGPQKEAAQAALKRLESGEVRSRDTATG